jgi:cbb3-type cytochrome oxidase subunit 3
MAAEVSGLEKLHEILLPEPVSWMPQTIGWYVVFGLVLLVVGWWVYRSLRRFQKNRYRRLALAELAVIERELQQPERRGKALAEIPFLLKWTALAAFPRIDVAGLSGERWLAFLDKTMGGKGFTEGVGCLLPELAYGLALRIADISDETIYKLLHLVRRWIKMHAAVIPSCRT